MNAVVEQQLDQHVAALAGVLNVLDVLGHDASSVTHLKANHGHVNAGCEDNFCCLGVNTHVKLGHDAKVSTGQSAAHHNNALDMLFDLWISFQQQCDICQRTKRHQRGFLASQSTLHDDTMLCFKCSFFKQTVWLNAIKFVAPHSGGAVDVTCVHRFSEQWLGSTTRNRHMLIPEFEQLEGVIGDVLDANISADGSNKLDIQRLCGQGKSQRNGVVNAGIRVNDDARLS